VRLLTASLLLLPLACSERIKKIDPPPPDPFCGDAVISPQIDEECEGSDLNGATCQSLGFDEGSLTCSDCKLVKTLCVKRCGNGVMDPGEACDGDAGLPGCSDFGYVSCSATCTVDRAHCVTTPYQTANGALALGKGGPAVVGDLSPRGLGELVITVPSRARVEVASYSVERAFGQESETRKFTFGNVPIQAFAQAFDIVALNADGTVDRYAFDAGAFTRQPFPDAGCTAPLIGELSGGEIAAASCDQSELHVFGAQLTRTPRNSGPAFTLADFDRDGKLDVLSLNGRQLDVHSPPSFAAADAGHLPAAVFFLSAGDFDEDGDLDLAGIAPPPGGVKLIENLGNGAFAERLTIPAPMAMHLRAADLDLDGRVDLVWESGDKAQVRRNQGSWVFAPFEATFTAGAGTSLSFALGDVDGDGDLDIVSTRAGAAMDSSVSYVQVNRVR